MRLWRYCLAGLIYDGMAFVFWTAVPVHAQHLGASATQVGFLQGISSTLYVLNSLFIGKLSDRVSKSLLARIGCLGAVAACLLGGGVATLPILFLVTPLLDLSASLFWPTIQGALGAESPPGGLERTLGRFNFMWSLGKTLGFLSAGWLLGQAGHFLTLLVAALAAVPIIFLLPKDVAAQPRAPDPEASSHPAVFRTMGYAANFASFGLGAACQAHFFRYLTLTESGLLWRRETFLGVFLATVFGAQTLSFWVLQRWTGWAYRRGLLYTLQALGVAGATLLCLAQNDILLLALAPLLGVSMGFAYASSIHYSLHGPADHGKYAGRHEAVLASGTALVPLLGGWLADTFRESRAPFLLAAGLIAGAIAVEEILYRRRSRS